MKGFRSSRSIVTFQQESLTQSQLLSLKVIHVVNSLHLPLCCGYKACLLKSIHVSVVCKLLLLCFLRWLKSRILVHVCMYCIAGYCLYCVLYNNENIVVCSCAV